MASARAYSSRIRCVSCQQHVLRSFISTFAIPSTAATSPPILKPRSAFKPFHTRASLRINETTSTDRDKATSELRGKITQNERNEKALGDSSIVPWYLRNQQHAVEPETNPFAERQRIPDLPPNPPPILDSLLKYISVDLGLDYLSILDLRTLDPPPALGANLIMVLGTVRGEKHLNVSADRLCRMLRTEYKLSPQADGLLGRNELKLKLRRKNRRSKMLGAVGAKDRSDMDDGIRTGWICVNIGEVEDGTEVSAQEKAMRDQSFIGFGSGGYGAKIVVQMLTEDRRGEVDLEGLWQGALDRAAKKAERVREQSYNDDSMKGNAGNEQAQATEVNIAKQTSIPTTSPSRSRPYQQVRSFHTVRALSDQDTPQTSRYADLFAHMRSRAQKRKPDAESNPSPVTSEEQAVKMRTQLDNLFRLSDQVAWDALGRDESDTTSTSFLSSFYENWPIFPDSTHYDCLIEFHCFALRQGHTGYTKNALMRYLNQMEAENLHISEHSFLLVLETMLSPQFYPDDAQGNESGSNAIDALRTDLGRAFDILEKMEAHGHEILQDAVFLALHRAVSSQALLSEKPFSHRKGQPVKRFQVDAMVHQNHLRKVMRQVYEPDSNDVYMEMLISYGSAFEWNGFWEIWREMARCMRPRSPQMYVLMFRFVTIQGNEARCQEALRDHVEEMGREFPPVMLEGDVAKAVVDCLVAANVQLDDPFWAALWERCQQAIPEAFVEAGTALRETVRQHESDHSVVRKLISPQ